MKRVRFGWLALCLALAAGLSATRAAEPPHHDIHIALDPASGTIEVRDRIAVSGRESLHLRLADWLRVSGVRIDGRARDAHPARGTLTLALPDDGRHEVEIVAGGAIRGREEDATQRGGAAGPTVGPDGVYLPGWAGWFPDLGDVDATYALTVETPADYRAVATGELVSEELGGGRNQAQFASTGLRERPSVFAGPYTVSEEKVAGIRIRTYFHRTAAALAEDYIEAAATYLKYFAGRIGPYPFANFHIISAPLPVGLGFPSLTYVDRRILPLPFMKGRSLAHEVLHNWWGNGVIADYKTGNWAEGLTTYMADHGLAADRSAQESEEMRLGWLRDYAALTAADDVPVTRFRAKSHDATQVVGYGKVAFIFHMLRHEIGEAAFTEGLRGFWREHRFATAGWSDLRQAFQAASGRDLGWFFAQWTERAGAPELKLADAAVAAEGDGFALNLTLAQAAPAYRLKVPVEIVTEAGAVRADVVSQIRMTTATIELDAEPISVRVDPDHALFRHLLPGEAPPILRDVLLDREAGAVLLYDAAEERGLARQLAGRLFQAPPATAFATPDSPPGTPLLVIGPPERIDSVMELLGVAERPAAVSGKGAARAWTARQTDGKAVLFVEAEDSGALQQLLRPLPHYRSKSYVIVEGGRGVENGVWPASGDALTKRFQ